MYVYTCIVITVYLIHAFGNVNKSHCIQSSVCHCVHAEERVQLRYCMF